MRRIRVTATKSNISASYYDINFANPEQIFNNLYINYNNLYLLLGFVSVLHSFFINSSRILHICCVKFSLQN